MTKAGVGFIIGGVVVYILGSQTQVGWLYLFDAMIWSVLALSFFLTRWSLGPLRIERQALVSRSQDSRLDPATPVEGGTVGSSSTSVSPESPQAAAIRPTSMTSEKSIFFIVQILRI